jgi:hypothetical protein
MQIFIGGIMQGSRRDRYIDDQDYRRRITELVLEVHPDVEVLDPNEIHPNGVDYDDLQAKETLLSLFALASKADVLIAYAPQASMGTAIEIWQAYQAGAPVVTISPMDGNWVIRHLSAAVLPDLDAFRLWLADGGLDKVTKLH